MIIFIWILAQTKTVSEHSFYENMLERFQRALENDRRLRNPFLRPSSCDGLARIIVYYLDEYFSSYNIYEIPEDYLRKLCQIFENIRVRFCPGCNNYVELCNRLCLYLSRIPRLHALERGIRELCIEFRSRIPQLRNKFNTISIYDSYRNRIQMFEIPIFDYQRSNVRLSQYLELSCDDIGKVRSYSYDFYLYAHQREAIDMLQESKNKTIIVSTPNASGKTEIAILGALNFYRNSIRNILILVVYPTKALARDQFSRWFRAIYEYLHSQRIPTNVRRTRIRGRDTEYALISGDLDLILLDGELVRRKDVRSTVSELRKSNSILIVLTNPAFLLAITRRGRSSYHYYFGRRCIALIVLDEIHFYRSRDLTLLIEIIKYLIREYGCFDLFRKILILSATVGSLKTFCDQLQAALREVDVNDVQSVVGSIDRNRRIGTKYVYVVALNDDREAESLIREIVLELIRRSLSYHKVDLDNIEKTLIFVPNRNIAERLCRILQNEVYNLCRNNDLSHDDCIRVRRSINRHLGDMALWEREIIEREFREGNIRILFTVKTLEVGIDIGDVQRVIHWGLPSSLNDFIQREGRVGRRPGEYESIIIVTSEREKQLVNRYIQVLQDPDLAAHYMYTPIINSDAALIKRLKADIKALGRVPDSVYVPPDLRWPVRFYLQDSRQFSVFDSNTRRRLREVRIEDLLFRYLPGMIRFIGDTMYIVESVDPDSRAIRVCRVPTQVVSRTSNQQENVLISIWGNYVTDPNFCLNIRYVLSGRIFTTGDISVSIEEKEPGYVVINMKPLGTKLIRLDYERENVQLPDGRVITRVIPVFKPCGYMPINQDLAEMLSSRVVTRGIIISINLSDISRLYNLVRDHMQRLIRSSINMFNQGFSEEKISQIATIIAALCRAMVVEYVHIALHIILDLLCGAIQILRGQFIRVRPEEFEHYVAVESEDELLKKVVDIIKSLLNPANNKSSESSMLDLKIKIAITNEVDLVFTVNWINVYNRIEGLLNDFNRYVERFLNTRSDAFSLRKFITEEFIPFLRNIIASAEFPRCNVTPYMLESIMNELAQNGEINQYLIEQAIMHIGTILEIARNILRAIIDNVARQSW